MDKICLIAVDGGASKTDLVLFQPDGTVLSRLVGGPSNSSEIGFAASAATLSELLTKLKSDFSHLTLEAVHLGLAGGGVGDNKLRYRQFLVGLFPQVPHLSNDSDSVSALNAGLPDGDGMVIIAGTGSGAFVRKASTIHQVGGWGHLLSDEGSGYDFGRRALRRALQDLDGRLPATSLTSLLAGKLGRPVDKAIPEIYSGGKRLIASLAPLVFQAAGTGDAAAGEIVRACAHELALLARGASKRLDGPVYQVVLAGGLWSAGEGILQNKVFTELGDSFLAIRPELPPVFGSAVAAMQDAGLPLGQDFAKNFKNTLADNK
jgi:N-acetylglucosamine kinase-like BadF-type ATPase